MKKKFIDISNKIDVFYVEIFDVIIHSITTSNIPFFLVGATARDFILSYGFDIELKRATRDIDIAVNVEDWDDFNNLKADLLKNDNIESTKNIYRLLFKNIYPIDIVPFGNIANSSHKISWPPENEVEFNTLGFKDVSKKTIEVKIRGNPELIIDVVDLPSLALLKIISFSDRSLRGEFRDAEDLAYLFDNYIYADNQDRLFDEHFEILDGEDYEIAAVRLLGKDLSEIVEQKTKSSLIKILEKEIKSDVSQLITRMVSSLDDGTEYQKRMKQLKAVKRGLLEEY